MAEHSCITTAGSSNFSYSSSAHYKTPHHHHLQIIILRRRFTTNINKMQKPDKKETVTFRAVSANEEGRKQVEKMEVEAHNIDTLKHIEKKLIDKGLHRLDRHPRDGIPLEKQPKGGRGGKYTWDGPGGPVSDELDPAPPAVDEKDPNYVSEEEEEKVANEAEEVVIGEVDVAKVAEQGVGRVDVDPHLKVA